MTDFIPGIVFTWLAIWILFAFTTNLLYPLVRPVIMGLHPAGGSRLLFSWITLPAFSALVSCLLLFAPMLNLMQQDPQCLTGGCGFNLNAGALVGPPAAIISAWLVLSCLTIYYRYWLPAQRLSRQLQLTSTPAGRYSSLAVKTPAAFTIGWLKPRIYLTEGLLAQCDKDDVECILSHEEAHRRRRDGLHQLLIRMFTSVLPSRLVRRQLDDYTLLCEQACDQEATKQLPDDQVAGTLLKIARLQSQRLPHAAATFVGGHVEARIMALFQPSQQGSSRLHTLLWAGLTLFLVSAPALSFHWLILR